METKISKINEAKISVNLFDSDGTTYRDGKLEKYVRYLVSDLYQNGIDIKALNVQFDIYKQIDRYKQNKYRQNSIIEIHELIINIDIVFDNQDTLYFEWYYDIQDRDYQSKVRFNKRKKFNKPNEKLTLSLNKELGKIKNINPKNIYVSQWQAFKRFIDNNIAYIEDLVFP